MTVTIPCPACRREVDLAVEQTGWKCTGCNTKVTLRPCRHCHRVAPSTASTTQANSVCAFCLKITFVTWRGEPRASVAQYLKDLHSLDFRPEAGERLLLHRCVARGGHGFRFAPGTCCSLAVSENALVLSEIDKTLTMRLPLNDVTSLEVGGAGTVTTGGGFVRGGVGLEGAGAGMLAAALLNAATRTSATDTLLSIVKPDGELLLQTTEMTPQALRLSLSAAFGRIESNRQRLAAAASSGQTEDLAAQLGRLAQLRADGVLSDEEFAAAKARLLGL